MAMPWECFYFGQFMQGPEAALLNKSSCLTAALSVTKSIAVIVMNRSHFVV